MGRQPKREISIKDPSLKILIQIFCKNVHARREKLNITQAQLAQRSGLATNTIAEIEQHRISDIRLSTITAIAKGLAEKPLSLCQK